MSFESELSYNLKETFLKASVFFYIIFYSHLNVLYKK